MHSASKSQRKNAKIVKNADRDEREGRHKVIGKGKDRAPKAIAGARKGNRKLARVVSRAQKKLDTDIARAKTAVAKARKDLHRHAGGSVLHQREAGPAAPAMVSPADRIIHRLLTKAAPEAAAATGPSWERHVHKADVGFPLKTFSLARMTDDELTACSKALGIRLSLAEMKAARDYFAGKGRDPTDVEMEALGQAWSEHCCYKSSKPVLKRNVYGIAEDKIVCREDAGVLPFDGDWYYSPKLESHNHPSAIEPYGGAATGIGGVIRDVVCMGAQPVALIDPLFFGPLDTPLESLPAGVKHPSFLLSGVTAGIRDYGNRVGIPTVAGGVTFHPGYTGNCLVNVGCVGVLRKDHLTHSKAGGVGDVFVYLGNPTGRDGIHGVAFASEELSEASEEASRSAVQVGDAILKEPLIHVTLELIEKGLVTGCKDFGGGGLSCVAGELAYDAGFGCEILLDAVPTKVPGMAPWEIWVSESQERMMVTCKIAQAEKVLQVARKWDVPAAVVGKVIKEKVNRVLYHHTKVLEFDLSFSTGGPVYDRPMQPRAIDRKSTLSFKEPKDLSEVLLALMAHPNVMSKEHIVRQYDHEVRANTVLKPFQGVMGHEGPGDAAVLKPVAESNKGLALSCDVNPNYCVRDPYWGAASAVDETVRNLAAVGARISSMCDNLNFGNPEKPERMWELSESTRGLGDMARVLDVPYSSGNVSLYNEGPSGPIPPTPTVMGIGILSHYAHATTMDLKEAGNPLFLLGHTFRDLGGSIYLEHLGLEGERVPQSDPELLKVLAEKLVSAIEKGLVRAAHDCSEGGIAVTLAEMAFAGKMGAKADLAPIGGFGDETDFAPGPMRSDHKLFSESNSRWIVEVPAAKAKEFHKHFDTPLVRKCVYPLGEVTDDGRVAIVDGRKKLVDLEAEACREAWRTALPRLLGVPA
ncbi:MAG: phosphoribosylformylglycinamidine synthase subunit PurL [Thermoplasmata archaeon]|jgi:phosphoribosylformylglycinamidine synthase|nr:phosphoribosylformylglycinamidine synthase subunit PurL [Thermoplasmata archaeon]